MTGWRDDLVRGGGGVVVGPGALPGLVGGADLLGQVRGDGGGGGGHVGDVGAFAAEVAGEEDEGDGPAEDRGEEGHGDRGRDLRRRHLVCFAAAGDGEGGRECGTGSASFLPCFFFFSRRGESIGLGLHGPNPHFDERSSSTLSSSALSSLSYLARPYFICSIF